MRKPIVGVMGPGEDASPEDTNTAYRLGKEIARKGWILLTGGRASGVMHAASQGAFEEGGITVGILPGQTREGASPYLSLPIVTGISEARNAVNVLSSDVIIGVGMNPGTASEIALAIKAQKSVFLLGCTEEGKEFFQQLSKGAIEFPSSLEETINGVEKLFRRAGLTKS